MISRIDDDFRAAFVRLPEPIQQQARAAYKLFRENPYHNSLQFKAVAPSVYSVRIGLHDRALGWRASTEEISWFWIGSHAEYDRLLKQL